MPVEQHCICFHTHSCLLEDVDHIEGMDIVDRTSCMGRSLDDDSSLGVVHFGIRAFGLHLEHFGHIDPVVLDVESSVVVAVVHPIRHKHFGPLDDNRVDGSGEHLFVQTLESGSWKEQKAHLHHHPSCQTLN